MGKPWRNRSNAAHPNISITWWPGYKTNWTTRHCFRRKSAYHFRRISLPSRKQYWNACFACTHTFTISIFPKWCDWAKRHISIHRSNISYFLCKNSILSIGENWLRCKSWSTSWRLKTDDPSKFRCIRAMRQHLALRGFVWFNWKISWRRGRGKKVFAYGSCAAATIFFLLWKLDYISDWFSSLQFVNYLFVLVIQCPDSS